MASWIKEEFEVEAKSFLELGFVTTTDIQVYKLAKDHHNVIVITTKDVDFLNYSSAIGAPPKVLYINTGNISNKKLKELFSKSLNEVINIFTKTNQHLIEINI